jgi:hypothetical protein
LLNIPLSRNKQSSKEKPAQKAGFLLKDILQNPTAEEADLIPLFYIFILQ